MFNKLFFEIEMTYKKVIIMAIAAAVFTAAMLIIPFTIHTSLGCPGTYLEVWIVLALVIIMNCETPKDAAIKTFIFFLISQPLIYLLQVPFSSLRWQIFMFYPRWFVLTLLTIPGAYIAWYIKMDNVWSALILCVATLYLAYQGTYYIPMMLNNFPYYSLAIIFCYAFAYILILTLLKNKKSKIIALVITSLGLAIILGMQLIMIVYQIMAFIE